MSQNLENTIDAMREQLCLAVVNLPPTASLEEVATQLDPLLQQGLQQLPPFNDNDQQLLSLTPKAISPLLVASDKGHVACLEYFCQAYLKANHKTVWLVMVGSPWESARNNSSGNTAVHHAAMANCKEAFTLFQRMVPAATVDDQNCCAILMLGRLPNVHGDTPLHMAAANGYLEFLQQWYALASIHNARDDIVSILQATNDNGDTCLSLACCHGHLPVVQFLLQTCQLPITHEELTACQQANSTGDNLVSSLLQQAPIDMTNAEPGQWDALLEWQDKHQRVQQCLAIIQTAYEEQVQAATQALLDDEEQENQDHPISKANHTKKKKKKKNKKKSKSHGQANTNQSSDTNDNKTNHTNGTQDKFHMTRLDDGRLAVSVPGETLPPPPIMDPTLVSNHTILANQPPSISTLFRQRLIDTIRTTNSNNNNNNNHNKKNNNKSTSKKASANHSASDDISNDATLEQELDALCLEASMLLYTPHQMALSLSPSQLEAVQQVLQHQMRAVHLAQKLQEQRHNRSDSISNNNKTDENENENGKN